MKFFNIDAHISVIADIKNIFENLGHQVDTLSISGHSWVFGKQQATPKVINTSNWTNIDEEMCDKFYEAYKNELDKYDSFIVTHTPVFCKLYEKFNKPIICISSTRYEYPYTTNKEKWLSLNRYLVNNKNIIRVTNNLFDKYYCETLAGGEWKYIPSLCEYTGEKYTGKNNNFILYSKYKNIDGTINKDSLGRYSWRELYDNKAIVHIPYNYSTMSIFEQYMANIPLLFPTKKHLVEMYLEGVAMSEISFLQVLRKQPDDLLNVFHNPNLYNNLNIFIENIRYADFYNEEWMPHIEYFDDDRELSTKLQILNFQEISNKMKEVNLDRKEKIYNLWKETINDL